jgi:hypothetical protein
MKTLVPPVIPFEHRCSLSWPSCPRCGQLCLFVDEAKYARSIVRNEWRCDACDQRFETVVCEKLGSNSQAARA